MLGEDIYNVVMFEGDRGEALFEVRCAMRSLIATIVRLWFPKLFED